MKYLAKHIILVLGLLTLCSCGFHLRGHAAIPAELMSLRITPFAPYEPFHKMLRQSLKYAGVQIVQDIESNQQIPILNISAPQFTERTVAYGRDGQAHRVSLILKIPYLLKDPQGRFQVPDHLIELQREINVNPNVILGAVNEKATVQKEMLREAVSQLFWQLSVINLKMDSP